MSQAKPRKARKMPARYGAPARRRSRSNASACDRAGETVGWATKVATVTAPQSKMAAAAGGCSCDVRDRILAGPLMQAIPAPRQRRADCRGNRGLTLKPEAHVGLPGRAKTIA